MTEKALFIIKMVFTIGLLASLCALSVIDADADCIDVMQVQARGGLNVRTGPGIEYRSIYLLEDTETVVVLDWRDGWALVGKNTPPHAAIGWVSGEYLK